MRTQPSALINSNFVTALARAFVVLSGLAILASLAQIVIAQAMLSSETLTKSPPNVPVAVSFVSSFRLYFVATLCASVITLVSSIGLLKRLNWARLVFIGTMALGIVWNVGGLLIKFTVGDSPDANAFQSIVMTMMVFGTGVPIVFSILFGWIILRLISPAIASEFGN